MDFVLRMKDVAPRIWGVDFPENINFEVKPGEVWCILGENGSGKTMLLDLISGKSGIRGGELKYGFFDPNNRPEGIKYASDMIRTMCFESAYKLADYNNMYYQQRFNSQDNELAPTVGELLKLSVEKKKGTRTLDADLLKSLMEKMKINDIIHKHIIMLSSGELRRFLIAEALISAPQLLLVDNPFIGLDPSMMKELNDFFTLLAKNGQMMIFSCPSEEEIPDCATHILPVKDRRYFPGIEKDKYLADADLRSTVFAPRKFKTDELQATVLSKPDFDEVFCMTNVNISYPGRTLFKDLNWRIMKGEKWSLSGQNGSGKSTLLSLLSADNPKAYSLDIRLFGRQRGTGESIWDIKRHIGYISSEMHLYFRQDQPCKKIVASGFFDTIGLFRTPTDAQYELALQWMKLLGIDHLAEQSFLKVSGGEQRLVLICRTMVKNPDLLILDEPLHGLDLANKRRVREIVEKYAAQDEKTLIYVTHRKAEIPSCVTKHFEIQKLG